MYVNLLDLNARQTCQKDIHKATQMAGFSACFDDRLINELHPHKEHINEFGQPLICFGLD